jgi:catechol-2,3-dioxygenase
MKVGSGMSSPRIARLNHAVLYVADAKAAAAFYCDVLGFEVAIEMQGAAFLRAGGSQNDHDLGLFSVGARPAAPHSVGLYHLAWQVDTIDELVELAAKLEKVGSLVGASDHGVSKSLYAKDIDGIEFEIMWSIPRSEWTKPENSMKTAALNLVAEQARWSSQPTAADLNVLV